jgi:hypothetical protein
VITDVKSNALSLKVNLMLERDEEKRCEMLMFLGTISEWHRFAGVRVRVRISTLAKPIPLAMGIGVG